jgi:choice-of-anchor B domain-containing protein
MTVRRGWFAVAALATVGVFASVSTLVAHPDDPKERDRQPRYEGPGYRRDRDGANLNGGFESLNVTLLSWLPLGEFGNHSSGNDCWGYVSGSGREYALMGLAGGTGVVEVTNPGNARIVGVIPGPNSTWRDIKTYQNYAYAVSEGGNGIQVIDLAQVDSGVVTLVNTVTTGGTTATHNVALNTDSGYLYRCGGSNEGLRIYSLANPANPVFVTSVSDRYVHDAQVVTFTSGPYAGREIAFCCAGFNGGFEQTGLWIVDVTDKQNTFTVSHTQYAQSAYSHQGWLSPDHQYFYMDDELDEDNFGYTTRTRVWDVSNISAPTVVSHFTSGTTSIDHNLYTRDEFIYEANYRSGLRVFDATDPVAPVQVAWFDTYPADDNSNFNGAWSTYPYLPSGIVLISDIERGLFVVDVSLPLLAFDFPNGLPDLIDPAGGTTVEVNVLPNESEPEPGTGILHVDTGEGFAPYPMSSIGDNQYVGTFPASSCGTEVRYYVTAETTDGEVFESPSGAPANFYTTLSASGLDIAFADDFETNQGWTVQNVDLTDGAWDRGLPLGDGSRGDPTTDFDGSGQCYLTDRASGNSDVDGGPTRLISPTFDLSGGADYQLSYARWFANDDNDGDRLTVEISDNNGSTWTLIESVGGTTGWVHRTVRVADYITPTAQVRIRFNATDNPNDSVTEAGIDAFEISAVECESGTVLTDFAVTSGSLLGGTLADLVDSDDSHVSTRSGFGNTFIDLHRLHLEVGATTTVQNPALIDVTVESRVNQPAGSGRLLLRNWNTNQFVQVGSFAVGNTDQAFSVNDIAAGAYVNASGEIDIQIKHYVFVPIFAFRFDSFFDQVRVTVE